jgi:hypothetical protein
MDLPGDLPGMPEYLIADLAGCFVVDLDRDRAVDMLGDLLPDLSPGLPAGLYRD